jgi:tetratricopeptide (TPR) repeat protein
VIERGVNGAGKRPEKRWASQSGNPAVDSDPRVEQLLDELLDSGCTPEEACRTCPELLPQVRDGWQRLRAVKAELGALFPSSPVHDGARPFPLPAADLPRISGYEVQQVLGRGGMGVVYKAWHERLNRAVALKMLLAGPFARPEELERFLREAQVVAGLRHANIVQVYDIGDLDGQPYFTMEYVEEGSLAQKLAGEPQPAEQAAALVATLAKAVHVAHDNGVVHRDLKPANILLTADGTPKITDFGLARRLEGGGGLTVSGVPMGTPSYMAPEQGQDKGGAIGPATDVYALGAILYELLTGRPPFRAETAVATLQQVLTEDPVPPSRLNSRVPRDLETICLKCLHKEPPRRYASAAALAEDLERYGRGEPIAARPAGRLERLARWVRRHRAAAALLAAVAVLLATISSGGLLLRQQQLAARARQGKTDQKFRAILERERERLEEGWQAHDLAKLTEARDAGIRATDLARSGGASAAVVQEAEAFRQDAALRLGRATKNQRLLNAVLDVWAPQETSAFFHDLASLMRLPSSHLDEQYLAAFRRWGLDMDAAAEDEVVERLRQEPKVVQQELIAALDEWILERRLQGRPQAERRRLFRLAEQLDTSEPHRRLRAWLVGRSPRPDTVAGFVGTGSPWLALWELARGDTWRGLWGLRQEIQPRTAPVLTVLLLARASAVAGDVKGAEEVLRQAAAARPQDVVLLDALGKLLERQNRFEEAVGYYRAARSHRPELGIALSRALLGANRATEAREVTQDLVLRQPGNPAFYIFLGSALYGEKKLSEAQAIFHEALNLDPNLAAAHYCLGVILADQRNDGEAEAHYRKAIDLKPDFAQAYNNLGHTLGRQGKSGAEALYRKAIDVNPFLPEAHRNLGNALMERQKYAEAEAAYRKAIEVKPDDADCYCGLGKALTNQDRLAEAEAACRKAIRLQPDLASAHDNLGAVLDHQGKDVEAEAAFRKAIELQPGLAWSHSNLGGVLLRRQRYVEAEASLHKAIDLKPDHADAYYNLAIALFRQGKFVNAEAACRKAIDLQYVTAPLYNNLGQLLGLQGKHVEAEAAFRKAIDLQPHLVQAHVHLGSALIGQQKYTEAEAALRTAIGLKPDFGVPRFFLGQALMRQARFEEAGTALKDAADLLPAQDASRLRSLKLQQLCQRWLILDRKLPAILTGKEKPANSNAQVDFAALCFWKKHYVAAACLYRDAFAAAPTLADNVPTDARYLAACAAAMAGCGQGKDADKLDGKDRARWRTQALDWLRQDLAGWGKAQASAEVHHRLRRWQADASLDGVRARQTLARMPDEERKQWESLWSDVDALLQSVNELK